MRLTEAVNVYVDQRRSAGSPFISGEVTLRSLSEYCGDIWLEELTEERVSQFLDKPGCSPVTRLSKFSAVKCFVEHFSVRDQMPALLLIKPAKPDEIVPPFIYTHAQVRSLLDGTGVCQSRAKDLCGQTFRMILLMLYATGGTIDEVLSLRWSDIDLRKKQVNIGESAFRDQRLLPIGGDLRQVLSGYRTNCRPKQDTLVFCSVDGRPISRHNLCARFRRLQRVVGLDRKAGERRPRLQDFRYTFAVHRLSSWIQTGAGLNEMLPALSAYMGYASLTTAQQFLAYVPDRFHKDLQKLSPKKGRTHWRADAALIADLSRL